MRVWTYGEIRAKVQKDVDIEGDVPLSPFDADPDFINGDELVGYCNEAIDEAEAEIHKLGSEDDYFLSEEFIELVIGTSEYSLPDTIYATKIRSIIYSSGAVIYTVKRFRSSHNRFEEIELSRTYGGAEDYRYYLKNTSADAGYKLVLIPAGRETSETAMRMYFIRNANRIPLVSEGTQALTDASLLDIPEFANFIMQYMKVRIMEKDGHPNYTTALQILQQQRKLMVDTLTQQVPDDDDRILGDSDIYGEHS